MGNLDRTRTKRPELGESPQKILVIEDDQGQHSIISAPLEKAFAYVQITFATSGEEGWAKSQEIDFDLIITDWRLDGDVSGLALLNRFRSDPYYQSIPIIVVSGYLTEPDFQLLKEFSFTNSVLKPFRAQLLTRTVKDVFSEAKWFLKQQDIVLNFLDELSRINKEEEQSKKVEDFLKNCPHPQPILLMATKMLRATEDYKGALNIMVKSQEFTIGNSLVDGELGKIYLGLGDLDKAKIHLDRAFAVSPSNLDRLIDLGKHQLEELDTDKAIEFFDMALDVDDESEEAIKGKFIAQKVDAFFRNNNPSSIPDSFAGLLNAIGISLIRKGDLKGGIDHYSSALDYINQSGIKASVFFNLGLAYLKFKQNQLAKDWLVRSLELRPDDLKTQSYLDRVNVVLGGNTEVVYTDLSNDMDLTDAEFKSAS